MPEDFFEQKKRVIAFQTRTSNEIIDVQNKQIKNGSKRFFINCIAFDVCPTWTAILETERLVGTCH